MNKILLTSLLAISLSATPALADHFTLPTGSATEKVVALSTIDLKNATNGNNNMAIQLNKSVRGGTLTIAGDTFDSGLGVHAPGKIVVKLNERRAPLQSHLRRRRRCRQQTQSRCCRL